MIHSQKEEGGVGDTLIDKQADSSEEVTLPNEAMESRDLTFRSEVVITSDNTTDEPRGNGDKEALLLQPRGEDSRCSSKGSNDYVEVINLDDANDDEIITKEYQPLAHDDENENFNLWNS